MYLMWLLPCTHRSHMCTHITHIHTSRQAHGQEFMTVNHGCDVCEWVVDEEKGQRAPGDAVYSTDRETEKESRRERGAWHCSSLSDGSSSGLRHDLPLISLSLDIKMEEKGGEEGG